MNNIDQEIQDLDRILILLDEYTNRVKRLYNQSIVEKTRTLTYTFAVTLISVLLTVIVFLLFRYEILHSIFYTVIFCGFPIVSLSIYYIFYFSRKRDFVHLQKKDMTIAVSQLASLIQLVSQYFEHNRNSLSELRTYELKLKLVEAEEILFIVGRNEYEDLKRKQDMYIYK